MVDEQQSPATNPQLQTLRIEVVQGKTEPEDSKLTGPVEDSGTDYRFNPTYHNFSSFLGVDRYKREDTNLANKISFIYDWGENKIGSKNATEITSFISQTMRDLGVQYRGPTLVNYLYQMARLNLDSERLKMEKEGKEMVDQAVGQKVKLEEVRPKIDKKEVEERVKQGIKGVQKDVRAAVRKEMTRAMKEGIQSAIKKAGEYGK